MIYNYLYIEDEVSHNFQKNLELNDFIKIDPIKPKNLKEQIEYIKNPPSNIDGILLDLRLDEDKNNKPDYSTAKTLAQDIRDKAKDGVIKEIPIVLISTEEKITKYLINDPASKNLFDYKICKSELTHKNDFNKILAGLAKGYQSISKLNQLIDILKDILKIKKDELDIRITSRFSKKAFVVDYSQFIINELINKSGPLINEKILAARLGVDIKKSTDWTALLNSLNPYKYKGVYGDIWDRWWFHKILRWWNLKIDKNKSIAIFDAKERVELIQKKTGYKNLVSAARIPKNESFKYWTICQAYEKPLDPIEGFRVIREETDKEPEIWQDIEYVSLESLLERDAIKKGFKLHPSEKQRFEATKNIYKK